MNRLGLLLGAAFAVVPGISATAMPVTGTNGGDALFFQGGPGPLNTSLASPSGAIVPINGTFNINTATYDGLGGIDVLLMTTADDFLSGADVQNVEVFSGGDGADVIDLGGIGDTVFISGGNGGDILFAGTGDDTIFGGPGDDLIDGGAGENEIRGEGGNDTFIAGAGLQFFFGDTDLDTVLFAPGLGLADIIVAEILSAPVRFTRPSSNPNFNPGSLFVQYANGALAGSFYAAISTEFFEISGTTYSASAFVDAVNAVDVPLPPSLALFGIGFAGLAVLRRRGARGDQLGEHRGGLAFHT